MVGKIFLYMLFLLTPLHGISSKNAQTYTSPIAYPHQIKNSCQQLLKSTAVLTFLCKAPSVKAVTQNDGLLRDFYEKWSYQSPNDILKYINDCCPQEGNVNQVIQAMDRFSTAYPMYKLSPLKASILSEAVSAFGPTKVLEVGTFFGYSALHIAKSMPQHCTLTCIEGNEANVQVAQQILCRAFGKDSSILKRIRIINGLSSTVISDPNASKRLMQFPSLTTNGDAETSAEDPFDFVFLDHDKDCYLPDLLKLQSRDFISKKRCCLVADNVVFPGAPDFLKYVGIDVAADKNSSIADVKKDTKSDGMSTSSFKIAQGRKGEQTTDKYDKYAGKWKSELVNVPFERVGFETNFKEKDDAMSISKLEMIDLK